MSLFYRQPKIFNFVSFVFSLPNVARIIHRIRFKLVQLSLQNVQIYTEKIKQHNSINRLAPICVTVILELVCPPQNSEGPHLQPSSSNMVYHYLALRHLKLFEQRLRQVNGFHSMKFSSEKSMKLSTKSLSLILYPELVFFRVSRKREDV